MPGDVFFLIDMYLISMLWGVASSVILCFSPIHNLQTFANILSVASRLRQV